MHKIELYVSPKIADSNEQIKELAAQSMRIPVDKILDLKIEKKSIDARRKPILIRLLLNVYTQGRAPIEEKTSYLHPTAQSKRVLIIGCGPAGTFAALQLLELGLKPIIIERGKPVRERRRDLAAINKDRIVNENSNYCFGEGGAGTYSDGKLYTRSGKRGSIDRVLKIFTEHGADEKIRYEAHPHIGTNKLPAIVSSMSDTIRQNGGEIHFNERVVDFLMQGDKIQGIVTESGKEFLGDAVILATGHSARDIYQLLERKKILQEVKSFALGVRIEHPQVLIDQIQYRCAIRDPFLPPASYSLVEQVGGRGVFSFCMCPGGIIAPAATAPGEVVVNGWSPSKRNNPYANSGMVVELRTDNFLPYQKFGNLAAMQYQADIERKAFIKAGSNLSAPAQRVNDFLRKKETDRLPPTSYIPGVVSVPLDEVLPEDIARALRGGLQAMGKKMKGYLSEEAVLVGVESRTSSPVRIPRYKETLQHPEITNLFPCGEGAGYAGGIVSAAIDGERCAVAASALLANRDF